MHCIMKISFNNILLPIFVLISGHFAFSQTTDSKPNILWIVANDLSTDLGCYGNEMVHTPALDKLASEGILYSNFYTVGTVCSPSRSAFITGMYAVSINSHNQFTKYKKPLPEPVVPITEYFKKSGYYVVNSRGIQMDQTNSYTGYNFAHNVEELFEGTDWRNRSSAQPFFAQVHLTYAHRPFHPDPERPLDPDKVVFPPYYPDHPLVRKDWALYLETVQLLDKQIGSILQRLEADGLADNTIVFFFADHGRPHIRGKQFLYVGGIHTPLIVRWPGQRSAGTRDDRMISNIDLGPTAMQLAGIEIPEYMQGRDFIGEDSNPRTHVFAMRDRCDGTLDRIRAVRTKDFKYIRNYYPEKPYTQFNAYKKWAYPVLTLMHVLHKKGELNSYQAAFMAKPRPAEELYHVVEDPFELNNLAEHPDYENILRELRTELDTLLNEVDKGPYPEDSREITDAQQIMREQYKTNMERKGLDPDISDEDFLLYWERELGIK